MKEIFAKGSSVTPNGQEQSAVVSKELLPPKNTSTQTIDLSSRQETSSTRNFSTPSLSLTNKNPLKQPETSPASSKSERRPPHFSSRFFDNKYKPPGSTETLSFLRDRSFEVGLPFLFAIQKLSGSLNRSQTEAFPCATFYFHFDSEDPQETRGNTEIFMQKKNNKETFYIGTIDEIESEKTPLGFHLLLLNNEEFSLPDPENLRGETLAASSILFRTGVSVEPDEQIADALLAMIPEDERNFHFGRAMIDALVEEDYKSAEACLQFGGEAKSVDDHGHLAISCALRPAAKRFLDLMLTRTGTKADVPLLREELRSTPGELSLGIIEVLNKHIERLGAS